MTKNLKMYLGIAAISLSSAFIGGVGTAFYIKHRLINFIEQGPRGTRIVAMKMLRRRLHLTDRQVKEIRPIVRNAQRKFIDLRQSHQPEIEMILHDAIKEIYPKLELEQKIEFDRLSDQLMKRFRHKFN